MEYDNFIETIRQRACKTAGKGGKAFINKVIKNNGKELDGLVILEEGYCVAPAIYLNDYYDDYRGGTDIDDIMNEILTIYYINRDSVCFNPEFFNDFNNIKNRIVFKLVNYDRNRKLLEGIPHKKYLDLAIVYFCMVQQFENNIATAMIKNEYLKNWNITSDELFALAKENTPKILKPRISPITGFLNELSGEEIYEDAGEDASMYVITNQTHINGAACMLYEGLFEGFANRLDKDLFILPSSIHEVIIVPVDDNISGEDLGIIVKDINEKGVAADEILSDNVYRYRRGEDTILL